VGAHFALASLEPGAAQEQEDQNRHSRDFQRQVNSVAQIGFAADQLSVKRDHTNQQQQESERRSQYQSAHAQEQRRKKDQHHQRATGVAEHKMILQRQQHAAQQPHDH